MTVVAFRLNAQRRLIWRHIIGVVEFLSVPTIRPLSVQDELIILISIMMRQVAVFVLSFVVVQNHLIFHYFLLLEVFSQILFLVADRIINFRFIVDSSKVLILQKLHTMILVLLHIYLLASCQAVDISTHTLFFFVVFTSCVVNYLVFVIQLVQRYRSFYYWQEISTTRISTFWKFDTRRSYLISGAPLLMFRNVYVFLTYAAFRARIRFLQDLQRIFLSWPRHIMIILRIFKYGWLTLFQYLWKIVILWKWLSFDSLSKFFGRRLCWSKVLLLMVMRI